MRDHTDATHPTELASPVTSPSTRHGAARHSCLPMVRTTAALASACSLALAACSASATGTSAATSTTSSTSSQGAWTTITAAVREDSTGATVSDVLAANADTSAVTAWASQAELSGSWDTSSATAITTDGTTVTANGPAADGVATDTTDGSTTVTISASGTYVLSGQLAGSVVVDAPDGDVHLVLDGATITSPTTTALEVRDAASAVVVLAEGSENTLTGGQQATDGDSPTATVSSRDSLLLTGTGSLTVTSTAEGSDAVASRNGLAVTGSPQLSVDAADDGLRGKDWLVVDGGTLTVTAGGDGLKSTEDNDEAKGFIALGAATISVTSGDDGVDATSDVTVEGTTLTVIAGGGQDAAQVAGRGAQAAAGPTDGALANGGPTGGQAPEPPADDAGSSQPDRPGPRSGDGGEPPQPPSGDQGQAAGQVPQTPPDGAAGSSGPADTAGADTVGTDAAADAGSAEALEASDDDTPTPKGITAGVAYTQDSGTVILDAADEGVQAAFPTINGGELTITSGDDGLNATASDHPVEGYEDAGREGDDGAWLTITGGTVQIANASSDGIDSNGSATVTGGQVLVCGSAGAPDGAVDVNGESQTVGVSANLSVSAGNTLTVTADSMHAWTLTSAISAPSVTVLGLSEATSYTLTTSAGGTVTATASQLGSASAGGPGGRR